MNQGPNRQGQRRHLDHRHAAGDLQGALGHGAGLDPLLQVADLRAAARRALRTDWLLKNAHPDQGEAYSEKCGFPVGVVLPKGQ